MEKTIYDRLFELRSEQDILKERIRYSTGETKHLLKLRLYAVSSSISINEDFQKYLLLSGAGLLQ